MTTDPLIDAAEAAIEGEGGRVLDEIAGNIDANMALYAAVQAFLTDLSKGTMAGEVAEKLTEAADAVTAALEKARMVQEMADRARQQFATDNPEGTT